MENIILCPYCLSPIEEDTVTCPACQLDTTQDAPHEMSRDEYARLPRKACRHCQASLPELAVYCPHCRQRQ